MVIYLDGLDCVFDFCVVGCDVDGLFCLCYGFCLEIIVMMDLCGCCVDIGLLGGVLWLGWDWVCDGLFWFVDCVWGILCLVLVFVFVVLLSCLNKNVVWKGWCFLWVVVEWIRNLD